MLDNGDDRCLPVVTAMLNPDLNLGYDDIRLQYVIAESHWSAPIAPPTPPPRDP